MTARMSSAVNAPHWLGLVALLYLLSASIALAEGMVLSGENSAEDRTATPDLQNDQRPQFTADNILQHIRAAQRQYSSNNIAPEDIVSPTPPAHPPSTVLPTMDDSESRQHGETTTNHIAPEGVSTPDPVHRRPSPADPAVVDGDHEEGGDGNSHQEQRPGIEEESVAPASPSPSQHQTDPSITNHAVDHQIITTEVADGGGLTKNTQMVIGSVVTLAGFIFAGAFFSYYSHRNDFRLLLQEPPDDQGQPNDSGSDNLSPSSTASSHDNEHQQILSDDVKDFTGGNPAADQSEGSSDASDPSSAASFSTNLATVIISAFAAAAIAM